MPFVIIANRDRSWTPAMKREKNPPGFSLLSNYLEKNYRYFPGGIIAAPENRPQFFSDRCCDLR